MERAMPTPLDEIDQLKERMGKYCEEITGLWKTLGPVESGFIDLPEEEVAKLRRRVSECESEVERLRAEMEDAGRREKARSQT